jgi:hypothetical protein
MLHAGLDLSRRRLDVCLLDQHLELAGFKVAIADAAKVKGLAPLACKTDRTGARVLPRAVPTRPGPPDLAADPWGARRAGAGPLPAAPGTPPHQPEEPQSTRPRWRLGMPARSPTCSALMAGRCLPALTCPRRGLATWLPRWR